MAKQNNKPEIKNEPKLEMETAPKTAQVNRRLEFEESIDRADQPELLFQKQNFIFLGLGLVTIILGFILMMGNSEQTLDTWKPENIYSFRVLTLAPIVVLSGLGIVIYAIFKNTSSKNTSPTPPAEEER